MTGYTRKKLGLASALALLAATSDAFAGIPGGGIIVYAPPAESIPTLSGTMLIVLGLFLSVLAYRVLRVYPGGRPLASIVALTIAGFSGVSATNGIQGAYAIAVYTMDQINGGSIPVNIIGSEVPVSNATGRTQQIKSVTPAPFCAVGPASSPACAPGLIVQPESSCNVRFDCES